VCSASQKLENAEAFCEQFGGERLHTCPCATVVAKTLGIARASVYRVLEGRYGRKTDSERSLGEQIGCDRRSSARLCRALRLDQGIAALLRLKVLDLSGSNRRI